MTRNPDEHPSAGSREPPLPEGVDHLGVPREDAGRNAFILTAAVTVALLGLIFTLGWIVFNHLVAG